MDYRRISAPLTREQKLEVCPLDLVKMQARIRHSDEDRLLISYICTAFDFLHGPEGWLNGYCLLQEEFEFFPGRFDRTVELPLRPFFMDNPVTVDERPSRATDYGTIDAGDYLVTQISDFAILARLVAPGYASYQTDALVTRIRFKAGWADPAHVPEPIRQSIMMLAAHFYTNREATMPETGTRTMSREIEYGLKSLAGRYRVSPDHS